MTNLLEVLLHISPSLTGEKGILIDDLTHQALEEKVDLTLFGGDVSLLQKVITKRVAIFRKVVKSYCRLVQIEGDTGRILDYVEDLTGIKRESEKVQ